jgi:hypothetical protein
MSDSDLIGGDPAPGNPASVRTLAREIQSTADRAHEARVALDGCTNDILSIGWEGEGAMKFHSVFAPMAPSLGLMAESYELASSALGSHAGRLDQLQAEVAQALARARVARQRRDAAGPQLDAARASVNRLNAELNAVNADTRRNMIVAPLYASDPASAAAHAQDLQRLQSTYRSVASALTSERARVGGLQREFDAANGELSSARRNADSIRDEFRRLENSTADRLHDALEKGLKNESNFHRLMHAADEIAHGLLRPDELILNALRKVDWHKLLLALHDFLKVVNDIVGFVAPIITLMFPEFAIVVAAIALLTFATGLVAYFTSTAAERKEHHIDGGELWWEGAGAVSSSFDAFHELKTASTAMKDVSVEEKGLNAWQRYKKADDTVVSYWKDLRYPDMRTAKGWIREFHGSQIPRKFAAVGVFSKVYEPIGKVHDILGARTSAKEDAEAVRGLAHAPLVKSNRQLRSGVSAPYAGACYAMAPAA